MKMKKIILFISAFILLNTSLKAQIFNKNNITGSFETKNKYYFKDKTSGATVPLDKFGSNSYLSLNYTKGKINVGIQYEAYLPPLLGFDSRYDDSGITHKYFTYRDDKFSFTVGNFYEQFGSGLLFRSWEDRQLGLNNSVEGINIHFTPSDYIFIKVLYGKQRTYFDTADSKIRGADALVNIAKMLDINSFVNINIGLGAIQRYEAYTGPNDDYPSTTEAYSFRVNISKGIFDLSAEYVHKGIDGVAFSKAISPEGKALLINNSYSFKGFGANISLRRLENMNFRALRNATENDLLMNYLPSNTKQQTYSLAALHPYPTVSIGEIGGQVDIYYTFKRKSALGGKYGTRISFNSSRYFKLDGLVSDNLYYTQSKFFASKSRALYYNYNFELKKKWNKKFKSNFSYVKQMYNKKELEGDYYDIIKSDVVAADLLLMISKRNSLRTEFQHLYTKDDDLNWFSALLELSIANRWSFYASDMYNYGSTKIHYANFGLVYSKGTSRIEFAAGRQRAGLLCVGGVCRLVPASTAVSFNLSKTF